jgi:hypothetical protein
MGVQPPPLGLRPHKARRTLLDPTVTCCPHEPCPARGHRGQGQSGSQAPQEQRCVCHAWPQTCSATPGPVVSRLRPSAETVVSRVTVRAQGCPGHAMVAALGGDARPGAAGGARAGRPGPAVPASLVAPPRHVGQGPAEERRVQPPGGRVGRARARRGPTRRWRGGAGAVPRPGRGGAAPRPGWPPSAPCGRPGAPPGIRARAAGPGGAQGALSASPQSASVTSGAGGRGAQDRGPGAAARHVSRPPRAAGAPLPGASAPHPDTACGPVRGGPGLALLHAACELVADTEDNAGHGSGEHRSGWDAARTGVVACAAGSLGATEAARASFTDTATPDRAMVRVTTVNCGATLCFLTANILILLSPHFYRKLLG